MAEPRGYFALDHPPPSGTKVGLLAYLAGNQPVFIEEFVIPEDAGIELALGPPLLTITGRVIDPNGEPVAGAGVAVRKLTTVPGARGRRVRERMERLVWEWAGKPVFTGPAGRFELVGLLDREYEVVAYRDDLSQIAYAGPLAAGASRVSLQIRPDQHRDVTVSVTDSRGKPVSNARVFAHFSPGERVSESIPGEHSTDAEGICVLRRVPQESLEIIVQKRGVKTAEIRLADGTTQQTLAVERFVECILDWQKDLPLPLTLTHAMEGDPVFQAPGGSWGLDSLHIERSLQTVWVHEEVTSLTLMANRQGGEAVVADWAGKLKADEINRLQFE